MKGGAGLSLACPREKLRIKEEKLSDVDSDEGPGEKQLNVGGVTFRISFVEPKEKREKDKPLPAREFALYRVGLYDMAAIRAMPWAEYRPFVLKLFGVPVPAYMDGRALAVGQAADTYSVAQNADVPKET